MFRTVIISHGEYIKVRDGWLVIEREEGNKRLPIEDLYAVVIDNHQATVTVPAIHALTDAGAHILICNEKHQPVSVILPQNTHFHPLTVIRKQIAMKDEEKEALWQRVVRGKIENQAEVLHLRGGERERVDRLRELAAEVTCGDRGNREGIAAKMFFRGIYGAEFVRMHDDAINAALNYGYAIIRSAVAKTLAAYGYNCVLGIHHINESNPFNLADDMMEPLRPIVDMWVDEHIDSLVDSLTREHRNSLAAIINEPVLMDGKKMHMRNAIDRYIRSLTTAIDRGDPGCLLLPVIIRKDVYGEVEGDD